MADGYDTDFYAWTQAQAYALRTRGSGGDALDYDNLAEEVEGLGDSHRRACESYIERILEHLMKIEFWGDPQCLRGWIAEVTIFRVDLERELTPSLRAHLPDELDPAYRAARRKLVAVLRRDEVTLQAPLPETCPYAWDDVLGRGEDWTPAPAASEV